MTEKILNDLIHTVSHKNLERFFRERNSMFRPTHQDIPVDDDQNLFKNGIMIGEIPFGWIDKLIVCAFDVNREYPNAAARKPSMI